MGYSSCPSCGAMVPDPAWRFRPQCGGRLPAGRMQGLPAAGRRRIIAAFILAAGIVLVLAGAVYFVHDSISLQGPAPAVANTSTASFPPAAPDVSGTTGNAPLPALPLQEMNRSPNRTVSSLPVDSTAAAPAPSRSSASAGPVITVTGASLYSDEAPATGSSPEIPVINEPSLAARVHDLVNKKRQDHGLSALGTDTALAFLARAHSEDMAAHGYFGHVNLQERDPTARGAAAGYICRKEYDTYYTYGIAENLFATYRYDPVLFAGSRAVDYGWKNEETIAEETVDAWMNSPEHRDNILDKGVDREGIGVAVAKNDLVFVTEDFC